MSADSFLAYIDPGSGTLLLQFIIGGAIGGLAYFRNQIVGLFSWVRRKTSAHKR